MADVSKIKLPDNTEVTIKDSRISGIDSAPTSGSENIVTSGGVYDAVSGVEQFYFVQGSSSAAGNSTSGSYLSTKWEGTIPGVSAATDGLKIAYRINTRTGVSGGGVVLSVDGTHYYPVVIQKNSMVTTHYPVGATVLMVFNSTQTATAYLTAGTKSTVTGCWQIMEYDSNTNTYQREYVSSDNVEYPITTRYNTTTGESYYAEYGRYSEGVTLNPSTNTITASKFKVTSGTSLQFLKADGSTDSNAYALASSVPAAQIQSDWNQTDTSAKDYIKNKPIIPDDKIFVVEFTIEQGQVEGEVEVSTTTTFSEIAAAVQAGKFVIGTAPGYILTLTDYEPGWFFLFNVITSWMSNDDLYLSNGQIYVGSENEVGLRWHEIFIPPAPGTLDTTATTAQSTSASEALSGNITLHKVAKTGTYSDLIGTPTIPTVPTISTNVATDKSSDTKTSSPKSVYDEIHPAVVTTQPAGGFVPNVLYNLGTLTGNVTFALATPADSSVVNHYYWTFDTGSTAPTITWPSGVSWVGGSAPTISASKHYEISILNNIGTYTEV